MLWFASSEVATPIGYSMGIDSPRNPHPLLYSGHRTTDGVEQTRG
jgi:hypothetical protein